MRHKRAIFIGPPSPEKAAGDLLQRFEPWRLRDSWLEMLLLIWILFVGISLLGGTCARNPAVVLTRDVQQGSVLDASSLGIAPLPLGVGGFVSISEASGIAARNLRAGTLLRRHDVLRRQARSVSRIYAGERLSEANTAFTLSAFDAGALTDMENGAFVASVSIPEKTVIQKRMVQKPDPPRLPSVYVEVPLLLVAGSPAQRVGARVTVLVRSSSGELLLIEGARVISNNFNHDQPVVTVEVSRDDAVRILKMLPNNTYIIGQ